MRLDWAELNNFRQYYGKQQIQFAKGPKRNVTVINGVNGAGKTSLFTALNWCLYGQGVENIGSLANKRALTEASIGETTEASVTIHFDHEGEHYVATRAIRVRRKSDDEFDDNFLHEFEMLNIRADGQTKVIKNPRGVIESILPSAVRTYFLFDGEKIDNFAKYDHESDVYDAVRKVLRIEVLERTRRHLNDTTRRYQDSLRSISSGELTDLMNQAAQREQEVADCKTEIEEKQKQRRTARNQFNDIEERLSEISAIQEWIEQRKDISRRMSEKEQEKDLVWLSIRDSINRGYLVLAESANKQATELLDEKRKRGEIPSGIREQFLKDILERAECICGRPIRNNQQEWNKLTRMLEAAIPSDVEDLVIRTSSALRVLESLSGKFPTELRNLMAKKVEIEGDLTELDDEKDEIGRKLAEIGREEDVEGEFEDVSQLENKRREYQQAIQKMDLDIARVQGRIEQINKEREVLKLRIKKEKVLEEKLANQKKKYMLAREAHDAVNGIFETFASDMRDRIQQEARSIFKRLIWKSTQFQDIRLSEDYKLDVIDRWGLPARPELSAGERQVLSLSFISGMARVSEEEAPLVMDTPFGRLSKAHRDNIAGHIPQIAKQLILFVTDEELRESSRERMKSYIGREYDLIFNQNTGCTTIECH